MEKESNLNTAFKRYLDPFKEKVIDPHIKKTEEARAIMANPNYQWKDDNQKNIAKTKLESLEAWVKFYDNFYQGASAMVKQHDNLILKISQMYEKWYDNVSNDGIQERDLMSAQADILQEVFWDMYNELKILNPNLKAPKALNLK